MLDIIRNTSITIYGFSAILIMLVMIVNFIQLVIGAVKLGAKHAKLFIQFKKDINIAKQRINND